MDEQKCKRTYEKDEERTLTGKEYLIDYMQNHNAEEIYELIKDLEQLSLEYNDSRLAFIDFLNGTDDIFNIFLSALKFKKLVQDEYGNWLMLTEVMNEV